MCGITCTWMDNVLSYLHLGGQCVRVLALGWLLDGVICIWIVNVWGYLHLDGQWVELSELGW